VTGDAISTDGKNVRQKNFVSIDCAMKAARFLTIDPDQLIAAEHEDGRRLDNLEQSADQLLKP
jgi:hypothetical protein